MKQTVGACRCSTIKIHIQQLIFFSDAVLHMCDEMRILMMLHQQTLTSSSHHRSLISFKSTTDDQAGNLSGRLCNSTRPVLGFARQEEEGQVIASRSQVPTWEYIMHKTYCLQCEWPASSRLARCS
ncbi:hypothetical protein BS78_04G321600 [Paspalum vaginatum]|nr:hypothetical protein BS78_04G321600 [Paspalum vaginatum]